MSRQSGFTLIEVLISVALIALLGMASALALNSAIRSDELVNRRIDEIDRLKRTQDQLRRDLEQTLARNGRDRLGDQRQSGFNAQPRPDSGAQGQLLDFYRGGRRQLGSRFAGSSIERVRYRLQGSNLIRESSPVLDPAGQPRWRSWVLLDTVEAMELRFYHNARWVDRWPPLNLDQPPVFPKAIQVRMTLPGYGLLTQNILLPEAS